MPFIYDQFDLIRVILVGVLVWLLVWLLVRLRTNSFHPAIYRSHATMLGEFQRHSLELSQKIDKINSLLDTQTAVISEANKELHQLRGDNISLLTLASENDALASERFQRVLPVSCYTSIDDPKVTGAITQPLGTAVSSTIITPTASSVLSDGTLNPPPPIKRGKRRPKGEPVSEEP